MAAAAAAAASWRKLLSLDADGGQSAVPAAAVQRAPLGQTGRDCVRFG